MVLTTARDCNVLALFSIFVIVRCIITTLIIRLPRYELLLREYKKHLPTSVRDSYALKVCV